MPIKNPVILLAASIFIAFQAAADDGIPAASLNGELIDKIKKEKYEDIDYLKGLIEKGADVNCLDSDGISALLHSIRGNKRKAFYLLLGNGANPALKVRGNYTPLHYLASRCRQNNIWNSRDIIALVEKGADVNGRSDKGETPLMGMVGYSSNTVSDDGVETLLRLGADPNMRDNDGNAALDKAADEKNTGIFNRLIEYGADVNGKDEDGQTVLFKAAEGNMTEIMRICIKSGARLDVQDKRGWTPLIDAVASQHYGVVKILLEAGAKVDLKDGEGKTALDLALSESYQPMSARLLMEHGADSSGIDENKIDEAMKDAKEQTGYVLSRIAGHADAATIEDLIKSGAEINGDYYGNTPLLSAVAGQNRDALHILLRHGADPNTATREGVTPLMMLSGYSDHLFYVYKKIILGRVLESYDGQNGIWNADDIGKLIDMGAKPNRQDPAGHTALMFAAFNHGGKNREEKLGALLEKGADPDIRDGNGETALFYALGADTKLFFMLVKAGADINVQNYDGETVLHRAARLGIGAVVSFYIREGADVAVKDKYGWTPLMAASSGGDPGTVKLLLDAGASPKDRAVSGDTALDLAMICDNRQAAKLLETAGAEPCPNAKLSMGAGYLVNEGADDATWNEGEAPRPEFVVQLAHSNGITCMDLSSDGRYAVTGSYDETIRLWDVRSEKLVRVFLGHEEHIEAVRFLPGNKSVLSASGDRTLKLWDLATGKVVKTLKGHTKGAEELHIAGGGKYALSVGGDSTVRLWDLPAGTEISRLDTEDPANTRADFTWSEDSSLFPDHYNAKIVRVEGNKKITELKGEFHDALLSPDEKYIVSLDENYKRDVLIWDAKTFDYLGMLTKPGYTMIKCLDFSKDGRLLVAGTNDASESNSPAEIAVWDFASRRFIRRFDSGGTVKNIKLLPDDNYALATIGADMAVWDIRTGKVFKKFERRSSSVSSIEVSPNGNYCLSENYVDDQIKLWNLDTGKLVSSIKGDPESIILNARFSPDGKTITYLSTIKKERSYIRSLITVDVREGTEIGSFPCSVENATNIDTSTDGRYAVSNSISPSGEIRIWEIKNGKEVGTIDMKPMKYINMVRFSADGKRLLAGSGRSKFGFSGGGVEEPGMMMLWDIATGKPLRMYISDDLSVQCVAFSPDGKYVLAATGHPDRNVPGDLQLFDSESGKKIRTFNGHTNCINTAAFSPDGKYIVSGSDDRTIRLWDAASGKALKVYDKHTADVYSLAFTRNGRYFISASRDGTMKYWNLYTGRSMSFVTNGKEWVIYNDRGYFDSSRNGSGLVAMVQGMSAFGIDQFAIKNNRPDLILSDMGMGGMELIDHFYSNHIRRLKRLGFKEDQLKNDGNLPEVEILGTKYKGKTIDITFSIRDNREALHHYSIFVNDCALFGSGGKKISGGGEKTVTETIELTSGKNKIEISAVNAAGAESFRALTFADYDKNVTGDLYFLGFGVSEYENKDLDLVYAHKDALDLAEVFSRMKGYPFAGVHVKTYLNKAVTVANIKGAGDFLEKAGVDDTVVLFIAGHGVYDRTKEATYYYLTHDAEIGNLSETAADFGLMEDLLEGIAPRKKLFLIDTCEAGELDDELQQEYFAMAGERGIKPRTSRSIGKELKKMRGLEPVPANAQKGQESGLRKYLYEKDRYIYNDLLRRSGAIVFSSSRGGEFSYESAEIGNGFFTEAIINALTGNDADKDKDHAISTGELKEFVTKDVSGRTGDRQHPTVDRDNIYLEFGFPVTHAK